MFQIYQFADRKSTTFAQIPVRSGVDFVHPTPPSVLTQFCSNLVFWMFMRSFIAVRKFRCPKSILVFLSYPDPLTAWILESVKGRICAPYSSYIFYSILLKFGILMHHEVRYRCKKIQNEIFAFWSFWNSILKLHGSQILSQFQHSRGIDGVEKVQATKNHSKQLFSECILCCEMKDCNGWSGFVFFKD